MRWHTHTAGGVASLWALAPLLGSAGVTSSSSTNLGVLAVCAAFGALLPDLDASDSRLQRIEIVKGIAPFSPIGKLLSSWLGHRGAMHSLAGLAIVSLVIGIPSALFLGPLPVAALVLGYASHLALDAMTVTGIPLLWPQRGRFWLLPRRLRFVTGSQEEEVVFVLLALLAASLLLRAVEGTHG